MKPVIRNFHIFAVLTCDEAKSLAGIKPLHRSCFFHVNSFSFLVLEVPGGSFDSVERGIRFVEGQAIVLGFKIYAIVPRMCKQHNRKAA